jgi:TolB-like protein/Flp pilus assembly protein TadD
MCWEMSSGEFPFTGSTPTAIRSAVIYSPLVSPPLSWSDQFLAVAFKCLSRSPTGRYRDGAALAAALKAIPLTAREHSWAQVRKAAIGVATLAAGLAIAVPAYRYLVATRPDRSAPVIEPVASTAAPVRTTTLAILPFKPFDPSTRDVALEFGLADALITSVTRLPGVVVRPTSAVITYAEHPASAAAAGRDLRVDVVVEGTVQMIRQQVRVSVRLFNVAEGRAVFDETFVGDSTGLVGVRNAVTRRIAQSLTPQIATQLADEQTRRALPNLDAYRAYLDGRYYSSQNTEASVRQAIAQFERATAIDPSFAPALAGLAEGQALLGLWGAGPVAATTERARTTALQALLADEALPEAHGSLALVKWAYDWNWEQSEREFKLALQLNPNYVTAHRWYAFMLASRGRVPEALAQLGRARDLDPRSLSIRMDVAEIHARAHELDAAVEELREILGFEPTSARAHNLLGLTSVLQGHVSEGISALERARQLDDNPRMLSSLAYAYGVGGNRARAASLLADLTALSKRRYVSPLAFSLIYTGLDDRTQAFIWLERALHERSDVMAIVEKDPWLAPLRGDERFGALLTRIEANRYH